MKSVLDKKPSRKTGIANDNIDQLRDLKNSFFFLKGSSSSSSKNMILIIIIIFILDSKGTM